MAFHDLDALSETVRELRRDVEVPWEELAAQYVCPDWFRDAKFGIWAHWGPQCIPEYGQGWYARHMYMPGGGDGFGEAAYDYHCKTYGHPSQFGFKDVIHQWKAERFDAEAVIGQCRVWGAKYFAVTACHHDHFDLFDSTYHPWNAVNVGPRRDIVGAFEQAARAVGLPFSVAVHDNNHFDWFKHAFDEDEGGAYDGNLTKADGRGLWWEGLDPADLYGPPMNERTPERLAAEKDRWLRRICELLDRYQPDMLYYDWPVNQGFIYDGYGQAAMERLYNNRLKKTGRLDAIAQLKCRQPGTVYVLERSFDNTIAAEPYQVETTFLDWFYKRDKPVIHSARSVAESLVDAVSKNANLLLSVELFPDGTYPDDLRAIMDQFSSWLRANGDGIFGTRPWFVYGDGPFYHNPSAAEGFGERTAASAPFDPNEVRFTRKGDTLYLYALNPSAGQVVVPNCGGDALNRMGVRVPIDRVAALGDGRPVAFEQTADRLMLHLPAGIDRSLPFGCEIGFFEGHIGICGQ